MQMPNVSMNKKTFAYTELFTVVLIWGVAPLFTLIAYDYYSASIYTCISSLISCIFLLMLNGKKLGEINGKYLKIAIPTGLFYTTASLCQKIGLNYTTPTKYAFLENLTCVSTPLISFILIKKKPNFITIFSCVACLASSFVLCGISSEGLNFGIGEILCAVAGIFYGANIAGTGAFAKELDTRLYLLLQHAVEVIIALLTAIILNIITIDGKPMEALKFSFSLKPVAFILSLALVNNTLCWLLRTASLKYLSSTVVAVIANFAAVVTSVASVIAGKDDLTANLVFGVILGIISIVLSAIGDAKDVKKELARGNSEQNLSDGRTPSDE